MYDISLFLDKRFTSVRVFTSYNAVLAENIKSRYRKSYSELLKNSENVIKTMCFLRRKKCMNRWKYPLGIFNEIKCRNQRRIHCNLVYDISLIIHKVFTSVYVIDLYNSLLMGFTKSCNWKYLQEFIKKSDKCQK